MLSLGFELALTSSEPLKIEQSSCTEAFCTGTISSISLEAERYTVSLKSQNSVGSSDAYVYPITIGENHFIHCMLCIERSSFATTEQQNLFLPQINDSCQTEVQLQCASAQDLNDNTTCTILYATDAGILQLGIADEITTTINSPVTVELNSTSYTYYFQFSVIVNGSFFIVETVQLSRTSKIYLYMQ